MQKKKVYKACQTLLTTCAHCKKDENILIVTDEGCMEMGMALWNAADDYPNRTLVLMNNRTITTIKIEKRKINPNIKDTCMLTTSPFYFTGLPH